MWDRPDLLNRATVALYVIAGGLLAYGVIVFVVHQPVFALRRVQITGDASHVTRTQVEAIVHNEMKGTFFTLDLPRMRSAFEKLPWVRQANLRRRWPDLLEVGVVEHVPLARWGKGALVNTHGEVFQAAYQGKLPLFVGPPDSTKEIAIQYEFFRRQLASIAAKPVMVQVTDRRAWRVKLESGPVLELGRQDIEGRLARYLAVHERTVGALNRRIDYVDLRYVNGFAVRIPELKGQPWKEGPAAVKRKTTRSAARRVGMQSRPGRVEGAAVESAAGGVGMQSRPGRMEGAAVIESAARRISGQLRPERVEGAAVIESAARRISGQLRPERSEGAA